MKNFKLFLLEAYYPELEDISNEYPTTDDDSRFTFNKKRNEIEQNNPLKLNPLELSTIKDYTGAGYTWVNTDLHKNNSHYQDSNHVINKDSDIHQDIHILHRIASSTPAYDDFYVYSGVSHGNLDDAVKEGGYVHSPSFMSTSLLPTIAGNYAANKTVAGSPARVLRIKVKKNQRIGTTIASYSQFNHENEFLLDHNKMLKITGVTKTTFPKSSWKEGMPVHVYDAEVLEDHEIPKHSDNEQVQLYHNFKQKLHFLKQPPTGFSEIESKVTDLHDTNDQHKLLDYFNNYNTLTRNQHKNYEALQSVLNNNLNIQKDTVKQAFMNHLDNDTKRESAFNEYLRNNASADDIKEIHNAYLNHPKKKADADWFVTTFNNYGEYKRKYQNG